MDITLDDFQKSLSEMIDTKFRDMGLDKVAKKEILGDTKDGEDVASLTGDAKVSRFIKAVVLGDHVTAKALSEGTGADGGYLVPTEFRASVIEKLVKEAVIRPRATVIPMSRDVMDIPAEDAGVTGYWKAESSPLVESNPTFAQVKLNTNKLTGLSKMSRELFADSAVGLTDYVTTLFAKKFAQMEDTAFMTGSGTGEPKGLRQYTIGSTPQAGASLVGDDLIALYYALPVQYRMRGVFLINNSIVKLIRTLKDGVLGRYLWTDGLGDAPATLFGRPVLEQNDIPTNLGTGLNESEIWFGDLSYYMIGDRQSVEVESTTQGAGTFENHQVALKMIERIDGKLGQTEAFHFLSGVK